ncbi:MAG TPA: ABC transporter permease [Chthoniobacterales bacterium]|nr:ABC transporter permease [Chthoniobacterales bacterium]
MELVTKLWWRLRALFGRSSIERDMDEELRAHISLRTEANIAAGMSPDEALRDARVRFGGLEGIKEACRDVRGAGMFDVLVQDVRFAGRMIRKYPGLSLVSVIGMSVAIAVAAGYFAVSNAFLDPTVPIPDGDRVVSLQNTDATGEGGDRQKARDFVAWRDGLKRVHELAAFATTRRNLLLAGRDLERVDVAQMTASGFRVARTAPHLGRVLLDVDEGAGAPPVVVIAHDEWQRVFGGDPAILGRQVRVGADVCTVVGVMPEGFRFPVNHRYWVPLRIRPADADSGGGPSLSIFGRLADGATLDDAEAELAVVGARMAAAYPETHQHFRPRVMPYAYPFLGLDDPHATLAIRGWQLGIALLLVVVAANVAILVYARVATRTGEIAVRMALGANRRRVIAQLSVEALVLSVSAAVIGLAIAAFGLDALQAHIRADANSQLPFWVRLGLSPAVIVYVAGLAITGGVIAGIIPALKATGLRVHAGLQQLSMRGSQQQLGQMWTALVVVQVAVAVAILPFAVYNAAKGVGRAFTQPSYPAHELLRASLSLEAATDSATSEAATADADKKRFRQLAGELLRRVEAEPGVSGVAFTSQFPGNERPARIEIEGMRQTEIPSQTVEPQGASIRTAEIEPDLFSLFTVPIVAGRAFLDSDARAASTVIVDQLFEERFLQGASALGRRVRFLNKANSGARPTEVEPGPWLEVVGVVPAFVASGDFDGSDPRVYRPMALEDASTRLQLAVRGQRDSLLDLAERVADIAAALDPALELDQVQCAADDELQERRASLFVAIGISAVTASVLLLSATGIYAMMSFTVTKRRREIGIRVALGADARRILSGIFARASAQLSAGVLTGFALAFAVDRAVGGGPLSEKGMLLLPAVAALLIIVGLLAALGPARRVLAVHPVEVLRED